MRILKEGKVEQRKFVCPDCGCEFVATLGDTEWWGDQVLSCPTCAAELPWDGGEPYEEPTQTHRDEERLRGLIQDWDWNHVGVQGIDRFLLEHGVTFKEA